MWGNKCEELLELALMPQKMCNCCLQRVLLVNLLAPSECFCVFFIVPNFEPSSFLSFLIYVIHCKSDVGDPTTEFPFLLFN